MERKLLGIMVAKRNIRKHVLKLYKQSNTLGLELCTFVPEDIDWEQKKVLALFYISKKWKEKKVVLPNVIYNRCYTIKKNIITSLESLIGENKCFNHKNLLSKWRVYKKLERTDIGAYLPKTYLYDESNLQKMLSDFNLLFLKPCYGHQGRGVYRVERLKNGDINLAQDSLPPRLIYRNDELFNQYINNLICNSKRYIIQQGISFIQINNRYFDLRALVQKNIKGIWEVSNIISRISYENYYNTSIVEAVSNGETILKALFPETKVMEIISKLNFLSIKAAEAFEKKMGEISVDFGVDNEGRPWIIEVNGFPNKSLYNKLTKIDNRELIYKRPLEYAYFLAEVDKRQIQN